MSPAPCHTAGCPAAASSLSTERRRTLKGDGSILVRHQAPGPSSRPIVGRRPSPPALPLLVSFWTNLQTFWFFEHPAAAPASQCLKKKPIQGTDQLPLTPIQQHDCKQYWTANKNMNYLIDQMIGKKGLNNRLTKLTTLLVRV